MSTFRLKPPTSAAHWAIHILHEACITQEISRFELFSRTNIAVSTLQKWWNGERIPNLDALEKALEAAGLELEVVSQGRNAAMIKAKAA